MDSDDASFADMRRPLTDPDADPLTLNEETVERLLTGDLPPWQVPPGYAQVAALLAATTVEPTPEELAGQSKVLAELRAVTRPRRAGAHIRRAARPARRRWAGLAAVALVGALVTGGVAVAATGNLPAPVRTVARSILGGAGGDLGQATPTRPDPQAAPDDASSPASAGTAAGPKGPLATGSAVPGSGPKQAGPVAEPDRERLCKAYLASQDKDRRKKMDAAAFKRLAEAAGGESRIPAYCNGTQPGDPKSNDEKQPPEGQEQGQGGSQPQPGNGGGQGQQGQPPTTQSSNR